MAVWPPHIEAGSSFLRYMVEDHREHCANHGFRLMSFEDGRRLGLAISDHDESSF